MNKLLLGAALLAVSTPVMAEPIEEKDYKTHHAMGCMLVQDCTDGVVEIKSLADVERIYGTSYDAIPRQEFDEIVRLSNEIGVKVFLAPAKYFPPHRS